MRRMIRLSMAFSAVVLLATVPLPASAADFPIADKVLVEKGKRQLHLLKNGIPFRTFKIALGLAPDGDKERHIDALIRRMRELLGEADYQTVFRAALDAILSDKEIAKKESKAFGCSIKRVEGSQG